MRAAYRSALDLLGGLGSLVKNKTVTVKLNLTGTEFAPFLGRPAGETYMTHFSTAFALAWLWANRIVSSVVAGPRTLAQWHDYTAAVGTVWTGEDEALVDSLVRPGHPSTPGYTDPRYPFFGRRLA